MTSPDRQYWKQFFTSEGRFPRSVYWLTLACMFGLYILMGGFFELAEQLELPEWVAVPLVAAMFPALFVSLIVHIKRWHDLDKSGAWVLIGIIPCVGGLWTLIECGFIEGTRGPNRYGPDPLSPRMPPPLPPGIPPRLPP